MLPCICADGEGRCDSSRYFSALDCGRGNNILDESSVKYEDGGVI